MTEKKKQPTEAAIEAIAIVCHEVNRAYCRAIGDETQKPWDEAPKWQRDSAIRGVKAHLADPQLTPEKSHQLWLDSKLAEGWRYGERKNEETKEHPAMLEYNVLPIEQRVKDYLFKGVVDGYRAADHG